MMDVDYKGRLAHNKTILTHSSPSDTSSLFTTSPSPPTPPSLLPPSQTQGSDGMMWAGVEGGW